MQREFTADHYLVAIIDVLGQSNAVLEGDTYPPTIEELEKTRSNLRETSEYIKSLRETLRNHYKKYRKNRGVFSGLSDSQKKIEQKMRTYIAEQRSVSDAIIINVPLKNNTENSVPINNILSTFQGICIVYNKALAEQKPIRGGRDVGLGTKIGHMEVYGSALVKAYQLESERADYPRILVGEALWQYINYVENQKVDTQFSRRAKELATECKTYVKRFHNQLFLDVIGEAVKTSDLNIDSSLVSRGYSYIVSYQRDSIMKNDQEIASRYKKLKEYYDSRLKHWDIGK
jgi:hypothetical protein